MMLSLLIYLFDYQGQMTNDNYPGQMTLLSFFRGYLCCGYVNTYKQRPNTHQAFTMPKILTSDILANRIVSNAIRRVLSAEAKEEIRDAKRKIRLNNKILKKINKQREKMMLKAMNTSLPDDDDLFGEEQSSSEDDFSDDDQSSSCDEPTVFPNKLISDNMLGEDKKPRYTMTTDDVERSSLRFGEFSHSNSFAHVANITIDQSVKRQTLIEFVSVDDDKWNDAGNWIYIFTVNDFIVKIGGTKNGLKQRTMSYLCGHHTRKSNACSITNGMIYNTFLAYLQEGSKIKMYGMRCPVVSTTIVVFGEEHTVEAQIFDVYESILIRKYTVEHGTPPVFSSRADPRYS